ncbi:ras family-domain-containing protein, partial [Pavlovales sp. CCMP2436]
MEIDGRRVKLQIWDTAGQERFRTITQAYYRGAMGIFLIYDVTKVKTWENIRNWVANIEANAPQTVNKVLIGNKSDLASERQERAHAPERRRRLPLPGARRGRPSCSERGHGGERGGEVDHHGQTGRARREEGQLRRLLQV